MNRERKMLPIRQLKMLDGEGPGGWSGYPSCTRELDDVGDIVLPGAYAEVIAEFLERGFHADSHEWTYGATIGYPVSAQEDDLGLYTESRFHGTPDAQAVRQKMSERAGAGKAVTQSIGYEVAQAYYLTPDQYAEKLPELLRPEVLAEGMAKARRFPKVRAITRMRHLFETSIVPWPALTSATVGDVKDMDVKEIKAALLGQHAEADATMGALQSLMGDLMWNVLYPAVYGDGKVGGMAMEEMTPSERVAVMRKGMDEFRDLACGMGEQMMAMMEALPAPKRAAAQAEAKAQRPALPVDAEELAGKQFERHTEALGTAVSEFVERASWAREQRSKSGRRLSVQQADRFAAIAGELKRAGEELGALAASDRQAPAEQVQAALARFEEITARLAA